MFTPLTSWLRPAPSRRRPTRLAGVELLESRDVPNATPFNLVTGPFSQNWTNVGLITAANNWAGVQSIVGYSDAGLGLGLDVDPRVVVTPAASVTPNVAQDVASNPDATFSSGLAEFEAIGNPVIGLRPDSTNQAPNLVIYLNTTGVNGTTVSFDIRDIDGGGRNSAQQVAVQYRIGNTGNFIPFSPPGVLGYEPDATEVNASSRVVPISVVLPAAADNQAMVQVRIITTEASGGDNEWIGIDNIVIDGNSRPTVVTTPGNTTYTEGAPAVQIDPPVTTPPSAGVQVSDPDTTAFVNGSLTVTITNVVAGQDVLSVNNQGTAVGQIGFNTTTGDVTYNAGSGAVVFGTRDATPGNPLDGQGGRPLRINLLNTNATTAAVTALARNITYRNTSEDPTAGTRQVEFVARDGVGGVSTAPTKGVNVVAVNDAPVVNTPAGKTMFEDTTLNVTGFSVSDVDVRTGTITVTLSILSADGILSTDGTLIVRTNVAGGVTAGQVTGNGTNVVTLTAPLAAVNATLANATGLVFTPSANFNTDGEGDLRLNVDVNDGGNGENGALGTPQTGSGFVTIRVTGVNDAPVTNLDPLAVGPLDYAINSPAILVAPDATVVDADVETTPNFNGGVLTVTVTGGASADNILRVRSEGFGTGQIFLQGQAPNTNILYTPPGEPPIIIARISSSGTGTIPLQVTFNNDRAIADRVRQVIRNITFATSGSSFDTTPRTINFNLTDGDGFSQTVAATNPTTVLYSTYDTTRVINPVAINNAPSFTLPSTAAPAVAEDAGPQTVTGFATNLSPGPAPYEASQVLTFVVTSNTNPGLFNAAPAISGTTGALTYTPAPNAYGTATITVVLQDTGGTSSGGADTSAPQTFTITVNAVADSPVVTPPAPSTNEDTQSGLITVAPIPADGGATPVTHIKVTGIQGGTLFLADGTTPVTDGTFVTAAAATAGFRFSPTANANGATGFGFSVQSSLSGTDAGLGGSVVSVPVTVNAVNDAPVLGGISGPVGYLVGEAAVFITPAATVADIDSADFAGGSLTVSITAGGGVSDTLAILHEGSGPGQVGVAGATVSYGGVLIGTFAGGTGGTALTLTLNAAATPAAVAAVLHRLTFSAPLGAGAGARSLDITLTDGDGGTSNVAALTVGVTDEVTVQSLTLAGSSPTAAATGTLSWQLTTDLPVNGFTTANFVLTGSLAGFATLTTVTGGPTVFTVTATLAANAGSGDLGLNLVNATGLSVNLTNTLPFDGQDYTIDRTGPAVTAFGDDDADDLVALGQAVTYTVTFDEPVDPASFDATADVVNVGNAPVTIALVGVTGNTVTLTVTASGAGTVVLSVPVGATISDLYGNGSPLAVAYTDTDTLTVDGVLPAVTTIANSTAGTNVTAPNAAVTYTVTFSEDVDAATVAAADFVNAGTAAVTIGAITETAPGVFTVVVTPTTLGTIRLQVGPALTDVAGNAMAAAATDAATVTVNAPPTPAADPAYATNEDTVLIVPAAAGVRANDTDPNDPTTALVVDTVLVTPPTKGTVVMSPDGSFVYTPFPDVNGTDTFVYRVSDPFGGSATATATVTIAAVNDPPVFTLPATPVTVREDAGPAVVTGFVTGLSAGPADEGGQGFSPFVVTLLTATPGLTFSTPPALSLAGRLTFTAAPDAFGTATFQVALADTGSGNAPNVNTATRTFTIVVTPVNDAPSFTLAGNPPIGGEDAGPQSVPGFAVFNPGPNEAAAGQVAAYEVTITGTTGGLTFTTPPAIAPDGTLTYQSAPNSFGSATVSVRVRDSGGTADGGADQSVVARSFVIVVRAENDLPTAAADSGLVPKDGGPTFLNVLANDDPDPDGNEVLTVVSVTAPANGTATVAPGGRGVLYTPNPGFTGTDTFRYTINDGSGGPATATVTVIVRAVPAGQPLFDSIAAGAGPGGGPVVRVNSLGTGGGLSSSFFAYDPNFRGGVNVALGDVNGDGVPDVVCTPGVGGGPHVKVIDGTKLGLVGADGSIAPEAVLASFFAYDAGLRGGVTVAVADVDGDGKADIITGTGPGGAAHVKVISGARLGIPAVNGQVAPSALLASFFAYDPSFTGGVNVAAGDVNGDGLADLITTPGAGGGAHVKVFDGLNGTRLLRSFFAYDRSFTGGVSVAAGDVNADGLADIIVGAGVGGGPHVKVFDSTAAPIASFFGLTGPAAGADVAFRVGLDGTPLVVVGSQTGSSQIRTYAAPDFRPVGGFDAFESGFLGGVEVG